MEARLAGKQGLRGLSIFVPAMSLGVGQGFMAQSPFPLLGGFSAAIGSPTPMQEGAESGQDGLWRGCGWGWGTFICRLVARAGRP